MPTNSGHRIAIRTGRTDARSGVDRRDSRHIHHLFIHPASLACVQVWRVWQARHTKDISLLMYTFFTAGVALWLAYGILLEAWPIIIANSITLLLAGTVLVLKLRFG